MKNAASYLAPLIFLLFPSLAFASSGEQPWIDLTSHWVGYTAVTVFLLSYILVIMEEKIHMRKSKPVMMAAGIIWILIAIVYVNHGFTHSVEVAIRHNFLEYTELFFFLLVAMTYINAMLERGVFDALRSWLVAKGYSYKTLFWLTGILAFFISPVADNLTTALIMCAVVMAVGVDKPKFIAIACINIVVAANAGGAFSPFGDITTLMVWQKGFVDFGTFFNLFIPSVVNFLIPAFVMHFWLPKGQPAPNDDGDTVQIKHGGLQIVCLFLVTIVTAVSFHNFLHIPPVYGMMFGLGYLKLYGYYIRNFQPVVPAMGDLDLPPGSNKDKRNQEPSLEAESDDFDIFDRVAKSEWDTLFFFYGVILSVGGLGFIGYLSLSSAYIYGELGPDVANILVGFMSAIVDNIPVMFAVLTMNPDMSEFHWLLVTLTAGVGGSMLSIGSAAGVALMGQARGYYTFFSHLKWTPVITLGYAASIYAHYLING
jgi:NhaD family Na+/H+ antiporter